MDKNMFRSFRGLVFEHGFIIIEKSDGRFYVTNTEDHDMVFVAEYIEELVGGIEMNVLFKNRTLVVLLNDFWTSFFRKQSVGQGGDYSSDCSTSTESE